MLTRKREHPPESYISVWSVPSRWRKYYLMVFGASMLVVLSITVAHDFAAYRSDKEPLSIAVYTVRQFGAIVIALAAVSMIITEVIDIIMLFFEGRRARLEEARRQHIEEIKKAREEGIAEGLRRAELEQAKERFSQLFGTSDPTSSPDTDSGTQTDS